MRHALRYSFATLVIAAAMFTAACSSSPLEPTAKPAPAKARPTQPPVTSGYLVAWA